VGELFKVNRLWLFCHRHRKNERYFKKLLVITVDDGTANDAKLKAELYLGGKISETPILIDNTAFSRKCINCGYFTCNRPELLFAEEPINYTGWYCELGHRPSVCSTDLTVWSAIDFR